MRRILLMFGAALVILSCFVGFSTQVKAAPHNCTLHTFSLSGAGWVTRLVNTQVSQVVDLEYDWYEGQQTVHYALNGEYQGQYYLPADFGGISVFHETRLVNEIGNDGRYHLVSRVVPIVQTCSNWRQIDNVRDTHSVISDYL